MKCDAVILAGGRATPKMAALTGTDRRALFPYRGKPFVQWVYDFLRSCSEVERIAVVGPPEAAEGSWLEAGDTLVPEGSGLVQNLFSGVTAVSQPHSRVLITASDNPLLSTAAFQDFLHRSPQEAGLTYPILPHAAFLKRFPHATNIAIKLREGPYIGGDCVLMRSSDVAQLHSSIQAMIAARKSLPKVLRLLGPAFIVRFLARRVTIREVEERVTRITSVPFRVVPDSDPVFAIDIDDPEDWEYLLNWEMRTA